MAPPYLPRARKISFATTDELNEYYTSLPDALANLEKQGRVGLYPQEWELAKESAERWLDKQGLPRASGRSGSVDEAKRVSEGQNTGDKRIRTTPPPLHTKKARLGRPILQSTTESTTDVAVLVPSEMELDATANDSLLARRLQEEELNVGSQPVAGPSRPRIPLTAHDSQIARELAAQFEAEGQDSIQGRAGDQSNLNVQPLTTNLLPQQLQMMTRGLKGKGKQHIQLQKLLSSGGPLTDLSDLPSDLRQLFTGQSSGGSFMDMPARMMGKEVDHDYFHMRPEDRGKKAEAVEGGEGIWGFDKELCKKFPGIKQYNFFCIQHHSATALHFDLRLQVRDKQGKAGTYSWAVPKGFVGMDRSTGDKFRQAIATPIHPISYSTYEGNDGRQFSGGRGGGTMLWDLGYYTIDSIKDREHSPANSDDEDSDEDPMGEYEERKLHQALFDSRVDIDGNVKSPAVQLTLRGGMKMKNFTFILKQTDQKYDRSGAVKSNWLISLPPGVRSYEYPADVDRSVKTGRTLQEVCGEVPTRWLPREDEELVGDGALSQEQDEVEALAMEAAESVGKAAHGRKR